jgi:hypothetical protein
MRGSKMRMHQLLVCAAWLVFVAAWFLPVIDEGVTLPQGLPGWQATRVALCGVWPCRDVIIDEWYKTVLFTVSALTTLLFLPGSVWVVWGGSKRVCLMFAWFAALAFVLNTHWYVLAGSNRADLRIGYYLWWISFLLMALGLFNLSRKMSASSTHLCACVL